MFHTLRAGLRDVSGADVHERIDQIINLSFVQDQINLGLFGWESCRRLIVAVVDLIKQVQGSSRVTQTQAQWVVVQSSMEQVTDSSWPVVLSQALEFIHERVNVLRIDAANMR